LLPGRNVCRRIAGLIGSGRDGNHRSSSSRSTGSATSTARDSLCVISGSKVTSLARQSTAIFNTIAEELCYIEKESKEAEIQLNKKYTLKSYEKDDEKTDEYAVWFKETDDEVRVYLCVNDELRKKFVLTSTEMKAVKGTFQTYGNDNGEIESAWGDFDNGYTAAGRTIIETKYNISCLGLRVSSWSGVIIPCVFTPLSSSSLQFKKCIKSPMITENKIAQNSNSADCANPETRLSSIVNEEADIDSAIVKHFELSLSGPNKAPIRKGCIFYLSLHVEL